MIEKLTFSFAASPESNDHEVRPLVEDMDILSVAPGGSYLGLDPPEFFRQASLINGGELIIGRCGCGVVGCGDYIATVEVSTDTVVWTITSTKRFAFDREQYLRCIRAGTTETSWESVERTAERLIEGLDFSSMESNGYRFQWASARIKRGQISLSFLNNGGQRLFEIRWDHLHSEDAVQRVKNWLNENA